MGDGNGRWSGRPLGYHPFPRTAVGAVGLGRGFGFCFHPRGYAQGGRGEEGIVQDMLCAPLPPLSRPVIPGIRGCKRVRALRARASPPRRRVLQRREAGDEGGVCFWFPVQGGSTCQSHEETSSVVKAPVIPPLFQHIARRRVYEQLWSFLRVCAVRRVLNFLPCET